MTRDPDFGLVAGLLLICTPLVPLLFAAVWFALGGS